MAKNSETIGEMMTKLFEYQNDRGYNCLIHCYTLLFEYGKDISTAPMRRNIEETVEFLLEMGRDNGVDMTRVINHVAKSGQTLLKRAAWCSENVVLLLTRMKVQVNEIDMHFQGVPFAVNSISI